MFKNYTNKIKIIFIKIRTKVLTRLLMKIINRISKTSGCKIKHLLTTFHLSFTMWPGCNRSSEDIVSFGIHYYLLLLFNNSISHY